MISYKPTRIPWNEIGITLLRWGMRNAEFPIYHMIRWNIIEFTWMKVSHISRQLIWYDIWYNISHIIVSSNHLIFWWNWKKRFPMSSYFPISPVSHMIWNMIWWNMIWWYAMVWYDRVKMKTYHQITLIWFDKISGFLELKSYEPQHNMISYPKNHEYDLSIGYACC